ncbi:MAG: hypothetical protein H7A33_05245 [Deltaproteobacteria bacterium]|nr:hypothetical protein [Deltaproteobacteria bacterium]
MSDPVKKYLSQIGQKGGRKSKRCLSPKEARRMVKVREARRAFKNFYTECFWSFDEDYKVELKDLDWVVDQLRKNGNRKAWEVAEKLCR